MNIMTIQTEIELSDATIDDFPGETENERKIHFLSAVFVDNDRNDRLEDDRESKRNDFRFTMQALLENNMNGGNLPENTIERLNEIAKLQTEVSPKVDAVDSLF